MDPRTSGSDVWERREGEPSSSLPPNWLLDIASIWFDEGILVRSPDGVNGPRSRHGPLAPKWPRVYIGPRLFLFSRLPILPPD